MVEDTRSLWAKCVFSFRQDLPLQGNWLQGNWSWVPHELCCLSFPHICLPLAAAMLGSSLAFAWCGCFLPACASSSWYFWVSTELPWSYLSGLMQGSFFIWVVLLPELQPFQSLVEVCWGALAPGFSSALSGSIYQWGKENAVLGSDPELKVFFSPWQQ